MRRLVSIGLVAAALAATTTIAVPSAGYALDPGIQFTADAASTWQTNGTVWAMGATEGKVFAGGYFTQLRPPGTAAGAASSISRANLAVLDAATGVPTDCVLNVTRGDTNTAIVRSIAVSPDGATVYIGGLFEAVETPTLISYRKNIAAIDVATCSVKSTFSPSVSSHVYAITATDSTVYFGGSFLSVNGTARSRLAAASATTGALAAWAPTTDDEMFALAIDPNNGNVIVGGRTNTVNGADSHAIAVVNGSTGTNVRTYPNGFYQYTAGTGQRAGTSVVKALSVDANGFYAGNEGTGGGVFDGRTAFNWGTYDQRWRDGCLGATQAVVPYQDVLYSASHAHDCTTEGTYIDGVRHFFLAQRTSDRSYLPWYPQANDGIGEGIGPRAMVVAATASGDVMWSGGEFTQINGIAQQGLTRFAGTPDTGAPTVPSNPTLLAVQPGKVQIAWQASIDADDQTLTYRIYRNGGGTPIATITADSVFWNRPQVTYIDTVPTGAFYSYQVTASDGTNTSALSASEGIYANPDGVAYPSAVLADGPSNYFRYDDQSPSLAAAWGTGSVGGVYNAGIAVNDPATTLFSDSRSVTFSGAAGDTPSFIYAGARSAAPTSFTLETWFKTTTTTGGELIGFGNRAKNNSVVSVSSQYDRNLYMTNDGRIATGVIANNGPQVLLSAAGLNNGQWHHVVATYGSQGQTLYVDGLQVAKSSVTGSQYTDAGFWRLGGDSLNGWPSAPSSTYWAGTLDETAIYPTALTKSQVMNHYQLSGQTGTLPTVPSDTYGARIFNDQPDVYWRLGESAGATVAADSAGNSNTGTIRNGVTLGQTGALSGFSNTAGMFTGTANGYVTSNATHVAPSRFSVEVWVKTASTTGGKLIGFGNAATGSSGSSDKHLYLTNAGKIIFGTYPGTQQIITSPLSYNNNSWHHVVGTQDSSGMKLYVDGTLVASNAVTANQTYAGYWRVGGDGLAGWPSAPTSSYLNGTLDEAAVYSYPLSQAQISAHYAAATGGGTADTTPPTAPSELTASISGSNVSLSWTAATDNVGVTEYQIHRSATAGFTPSAATLIGTATTTTYSDTPGVGTWRYVVVAVDAAANASPASNEASAAANDSTPPSAPTGLTAPVSGSSVQLAWTASTDNVGVSTYTVHRSATAGFTPSAANRIGDATGTSYTDGPAGGTWYYRVVAADAAGNTSASSNEASATIVTADTESPSVPTGLGATVAGSTVNLSWTASTDNVAVSGYAVHRSTTAGFTPSVSTKIADVTGTSASDSPGVGTFYYKVVASDAAGNTSAASAQASATVADAVAPSTPSGLTASVSGSSVALSWTASTDNVAVTGYAVHRSTTVGFTPSAATKIADASGTTYSDSPGVGTFYYKIVAVDAAGNTSIASPQASATVAGSAPTVVTLTAVEDSMVLQPAPGNNYGTSASMAVQGPVGSQFASYLKFTVPAAPAGKSLVGAKLSVATDSNSFSGSADVFTVSATSSSWTEAALTWNNRPAAGAAVGTLSGATSPSTVYESAALTASGLGVSAAGGSVSVVISSTGSDNLWLWTRQYADSTRQPKLILTYDGATDSVAPSAPAGLAASVSGSSVALSWTASTDNVGVTGYAVYRSASAGFTPSAATKIGDAAGPSYSDTVANGTWYYRVTALDSAGNESAGSNQASATVAGSAPTVVTLTAVEDSMVLQPAPGNNYGTSASMAVQGPVGSQFASYLKFTVPAAPAGKSLVGAKLSVATDSNSFSGSADVFTVSATSSSWTEAALTWNNRPAAGAAVGTLSGATSPSTVYESAALTASGLGVSAAGGSVSVVISSTGSDNLWLWTRQYADSTRQPKLILTYDGATDSVAPSAPAGLAASVSGSSVALSWTASTDNVGVTGYAVYRSASAGFTPSAATKIGDAAGPSYSDTVANGTWYYRVTALDSAGNESAGSNQASATVAGSAATVVTLTAVEDSMVLQPAPGNNYGTSASMAVQGPVGSQFASYLKFTVPAAPAGKSLVGAKLSVATDSNSFSGSADVFTVSATSSSWTEAALTWNNRPAAGAAVGTLSGATSPSTVYESAALTASGLGVSAAGGSVSVVISSTGSDNLWLWTRQYADSTRQPKLILTYQ